MTPELLKRLQGMYVGEPLHGRRVFSSNDCIEIQEGYKSFVAAMYHHNYDIDGKADRAIAEMFALSAKLVLAIQKFVDHVYCPNCGCDLWNTKGCPTCPAMREAYDLLVALGLKTARQYPEWAEPDPINKRNMMKGS